MQNTKNSKEVQGTGTAQKQLQHKLNAATEELFKEFELKSLEEKVDDLLLAWITSDHITFLNPNERSNFYFFYLNLIKLLKGIEHKTDSMELFNRFIDQWSYKYCKKKLKEILKAFLSTDEANHLETRTDIIHCHEIICKFIKSIYSIDAKFESLVAT